MKFLKEEFNIVQVIKIVIMISAGLYFLYWSQKVLEMLNYIFMAI